PPLATRLSCNLTPLGILLVQQTCEMISSTDPAPIHFYTLSLHDALPIYSSTRFIHDHLFPAANTGIAALRGQPAVIEAQGGNSRDRKSTRLNSSHQIISYAVFCLKKKIY